MSDQAMSRPPSDNVFQVAFKIPEEWISRADKLAAAMSRPGMAATRTDALRSALAQGLVALEAELSPSPSTKPGKKASSKR